MHERGEDVGVIRAGFPNRCLKQVVRTLRAGIPCCIQEFVFALEGKPAVRATAQQLDAMFPACRHAGRLMGTMPVAYAEGFLILPNAFNAKVGVAVFTDYPSRQAAQEALLACVTIHVADKGLEKWQQRIFAKNAAQVSVRISGKAGCKQLNARWNDLVQTCLGSSEELFQRPAGG